ncbi:hypothetical protein ATE84_4586 [Aquimarina sp. MAR_2010_214]|uniref:hypothetical protein n=1 Tax=Aquimarina sp. MAR_2010_214 TaxID=1250026 RepID=UPI000C714507|nr:hypothetical protein [Aquimarina sp. MAR_2010_214]PKV52470.1 hypothetical protein ATE84_4586 [Aquimarina sp. MAR_2010_214]
MKNRIFAFAGLLFITSSFLLSCSDDDNDTQIPTTAVTTSKQFKDIKSANKEIGSIVENVFNTENKTSNKSFSKVKTPQCATITSETTDQTKTITIDFGDNCELPNGEVISGSIRMSFSLQLDTESKIEISYSLEKIVYKDITVSGTATTIYSFQSDTGNTKFSTNSDFTFAWGDGLSATSKTNFVTETFAGNTNPDIPTSPIFYSLTTGNSLTEFSNGDRFAVEITTPLRDESSCQYTVSGVMATTENSAVITLNYGDGECDNIATQTDADGNETTIEL